MCSKVLLPRSASFARGLLCVALLVANCASGGAGTVDSDTYDQIRQLQHAWMQAWKDRDRAALEQILADDYVLIVSAAPDQPVSRSKWLDLALGDYVCESFKYANMTPRRIGDVVAVSSTLRVKASVKSVDRSMEFFITDLWQNRTGRWQVVQRYSSVPEGRTASSENVVRPQ